MEWASGSEPIGSEVPNPIETPVVDLLGLSEPIAAGRGVSEDTPMQPDTNMQEQFFDCSTPGLSEDAVNKIRHEASLQYETKVLEVVTEASSHIEVANNRAENAEWQAKQALEQVQHMRTFMQTEIGRQQNELAEQQAQFQAKSQEEARRNEELNSENRRLRAEAAQGRLLPIVFKDTSVGNAGQVQSSYAESTQPSLQHKSQNNTSSKTLLGH